MKLKIIFYISLIFSIFPAYAETPSLCEHNETTVWSCHADDKTYSVCASSVLTDTKGYLQYRSDFYSADAVFTYPSQLLHPKGYLAFNLMSKEASLSFKSESDAYLITEDINGAATLRLTQQGQDALTIFCDESTDTLTLTSTIELLKTAGIMQ